MSCASCVLALPANTTMLLSDIISLPLSPGCVAGAPGFEPGNGGIKTRCLTTWLRPKGIQRRPVQTARDDSAPAVRQTRKRVVRSFGVVEGRKHAPSGTGHPRAVRVIIKPIQRGGHLGIARADQRLEIVASTARNKVGYCQARRIPCQFRRLE